MRVEEFKIWASNSLQQGSVNSYTYYIQRVAEAEGINIDEEFDKDGLQGLIARYGNTVAEAQEKGVEPPKINVGANSLGDYRSILRKYRKFCLSDDDYSVSVEPESESGTDEGATFGLERDMQEAMRETITQLESGLEIIDGGVERKVDSGFIDILAKDSNGAFVVIELKAGKASDSVIAQTLGYMVDIADAEGLEINQVRGIIVAKSFNKRIETAARAVPSLTLKAYTYSFDFN